MNHTFGYVYVLTNPSIPNQIKVGMTQRRPERRGAELSSATGVPEEFQVFYYRSFEDAGAAERIVHGVLDEQGARKARNREFFSVSAEDAKALIDRVAERLEDPESASKFAETFIGRALALLEAERTSMADMEEVLNLLEHATGLGDASAPYLAGNCAHELAQRRKSSSDAVRQGLLTRSRELYLLAAERGLVRGFAQAAAVSLVLGETLDYVRQWDRYFVEMQSEAGGIPEEEFDFILAFMDANMFSGAKACPQVNDPLRMAGRRLRARARELGMEGEFIAWLDDYVSSLHERLLERAKLPLIGLAVLFIVFLWKPGAVIIFTAGLLFLLGIGAAAKRFVTKRKNTSTTKRKKR